MTQDEIIWQNEVLEMAMNSGLPSKEAAQYQLWWLEAFAKLVEERTVAKERYACMNICLNFADVDSGPNGIEQDYHAKLIAARGES